MNVTQLSQICRAAPVERLAVFAPRITRAMEEFGVSTWRRQAAFIAQAAHESGEFLHMREIWGPTPAQLRYEPPGKKAAELGNTRKGDGRRFCGRGIFQVTGRGNYAECSRDLFPGDPELLIRRPDLLEQPTQACRSAGWYWAKRGLNQWADSGQFQTLTRRINGGLNGYDERVRYWKRAIAALEPQSTPGWAGGDE